MALNNKSLLKNQAEVIRYEDSEGNNTAERVGKMLVDIIDATDSSLSEETKARENTDKTLQDTLNSTTAIANNAMNTASESKSRAENAQKTADSAQKTADEASEVAKTNTASIEKINNKIGAANGIAPLDENGLVPSKHIPT